MAGPALAAAHVEAAGRYVHWGVIQISLTNLLVIVAMILVFIAAVVFRMPGSNEPATPPTAAREEGPDDAR